jgi:anti-sigma regulatory factor (Ser/Thr protein kinase)
MPMSPTLGQGWKDKRLMPNHTISFKVASDVSELERLCQIVEEFGEANNLPAEAVFQITLILEEVVSNSIKYGYQGQPGHFIELNISLACGMVVIDVEDSGVPFNLLEAPMPDLHCPVEERPIGGLGIYLTRTLMDGVEYERREGKNCLRLRKKISAGCAGR